MKDKIVIVTGGFDPIHSGHIEYIKSAVQHGRVVIGLNSDEWLTRKKGKPFMSFEERFSILNQLKNVLTVIGFDDSDGTACDAIEKVKKLFPHSNIVFANGGDRTSSNIPEMERYKDDSSVEFLFGIGGEDKKNSSSWILKDWKAPETQRLWGSYLNYYDTQYVKVKRLIIKPGQSISMQYHNNRSEFWFIESGQGEIFSVVNNCITSFYIYPHQSNFVRQKEWHKIKNVSLTEDLCIIEIQFGSECSEDDIVRI